MSCKYYLKVQLIMKMENLFRTNTNPSVENIEAILSYEFREKMDIDTFYENYTSGKYTRYLAGRRDRMKFYSSMGWRSLKKVALSIYGSKCMKCGSTKDICVDHLASRQLEPSKSLDINNLGILCESCNLKKSYHSEDYRRLEDLEKLKQYLLKSA